MNLDPLDAFTKRWDEKIEEFKQLPLSPKQVGEKLRALRIDHRHYRLNGNERRSKYSQYEQDEKFNRIYANLRDALDISAINFDKMNHDQEIDKLKNTKGFFDGVKELSFSLHVKFLNFLGRDKT